MDLWQIFQEPWAFRALLASTMVGVTCGILGVFIVLRNMSLIGDALSHAILPGVFVAFILFGYNTLGFFFGTVIAGLVFAILMTWIQQNTRTKNDAVIGIVFTAMFSLGVIGISSISRTGVHIDMKDFLFGNVLGVSNQDLIMNGTVMVMVALSIVVFYRYLFASTFQPTIASTMGIPVKLMHYYLMLLLSFSVVAAMQTVGVILVVAMLITPASTALLLANRLPKVLLIAGIIGFLSSLSGLIFSIWYEMPPGPSIAVTATCIYLLAAFFSPEHGLLAKWFTRRKQQQKIKAEDILKEAFKISLGNPFPIDRIKEKLSIPGPQLKLVLQSLTHQKLVKPLDRENFELTEAGKEQANNLIRAHRLWESYLVNEMGMDADQIHDEAERIEHLLTSAQVDEVDKQLGYPALDPHGSPIPSKESLPNLALNQMQKTERGIISQRQPGTEITYKLWDLGLGPGDHFEVAETGKDFILHVKQSSVTIPEALAERISVEKVEGARVMK
jgi:ABC-type Mn2+/Zn2+ transport system permease subunit/Mn-dependent DtxR family transcriptional regulator